MFSFAAPILPGCPVKRHVPTIGAPATTRGRIANDHEISGCDDVTCVCGRASDGIAALGSRLAVDLGGVMGTAVGSLLPASLGGALPVGIGGVAAIAALTLIAGIQLVKRKGSSARPPAVRRRTRLHPQWNPIA